MTQRPKLMMSETEIKADKTKMQRKAIGEL